MGWRNVRRNAYSFDELRIPQPPKIIVTLLDLRAGQHLHQDRFRDRKSASSISDKRGQHCLKPMSH